MAELLNYEVLNRVREKLFAAGVSFPVLVGNADSPADRMTLMAITLLPDFKRFSIRQHFGEFSLPESKRAFNECLRAFDTLARTVPADTFQDSDDKEAEDAVRSFVMVSAKQLEKDPEIASRMSEILQSIAASQQSVAALPRVVQHRDASPSNWRFTQVNDQSFISFIDLETLGLARRGWDEGRLFTLLCLDSGKQAEFLSAVMNHPSFEDKEAKIYFWRTVVVRSLRELYLLESGRYDNLLKKLESAEALATKRQIYDALKRTLLDRAQPELRALLGEQRSQVSTRESSVEK